MAIPGDRLYELLPVVYRERDAAEGYPLRALLRIVTAQADLVEQDIRTLWDDFFIETCRPWVIPYIGDLVGNRLLYDAGRLPENGTAQQLFRDLTGPDLRPPIAVRTRADVAKTIYYRRRKATLPMLEELARDVTGWPAHAVEFFTLLGWTQHREHLRFESRWADVRSVDRMDRVGGAFDEISHTVDVRRIAQTEGWHNIHNIGFFLYRLKSYGLQRVPARQAGAPWRYHFSPLGNPAPLFSRWRREGDEAGLATELHVAAPIRHAFFYEDLVRHRNLVPPPDRPDATDLYGLEDDRSFFLWRNGQPVFPAQNPAAPPAVYQPQIVCHRLDPWPAAQPAGRLIAVDVESGRLAVGDGWGDATASLDVDYHYGFPSDLGGGPYERAPWLLRQDPGVRRLFVREGTPAGVPGTYASLTAALTDWAGPLGRPDAVITLLDSRTYALPAAIALRNEGLLVLQAADQQRPLLQAPAGGLAVQVLPPATLGDPERDASLTLSGVVVEGHVEITGDLGLFRLLHATLVPGRRLQEDGAPATADPSLVVDGGVPGAEINTKLRVEISFSITGALVVPEHSAGVWLLDSFVDGFLDGRAAGQAALAGIAGIGGGAGPDLRAERSTLFGTLEVRSLELSESIVTGRVDTVRTQEGCVRFSFVPFASRTPRRYRCQPDLEIDQETEQALARDPGLTPAARLQIRDFVRAFLVPAFTTSRYGQPAYGQLRLSCPVQIRTGAEDGSEMGAFCHVKQPQREGNLRLRLDEYLPFGLEAGILFAT